MEMDGCIGLSMICDRDSGRCIVTSAWSTEEARDATEETVQPLRDKGADIFGAQPSMDRWEIAVLHRDAPSAELVGLPDVGHLHSPERGAQIAAELTPVAAPVANA